MAQMQEETVSPRKKARRKYEVTHKAERKQATGQFNTRLPRKIFDEINDFLKENQIQKIDLIYAGYGALRAEVEERNRQLRELQQKED